MPVLEMAKEKDKAPENVSFTCGKTHHRGLQKARVAQVASFFSRRNKAFPSDVHLDSPYKNCKSISF